MQKVAAIHTNNFMHSQSQNDDLTGLISNNTKEEEKYVDEDMYDDEENANTDEGAHLQPTVVPNLPQEAVNNDEEEEDEDLE